MNKETLERHGFEVDEYSVSIQGWYVTPKVITRFAGVLMHESVMGIRPSPEFDLECTEFMRARCCPVSVLLPVSIIARFGI